MSIHYDIVIIGAGVVGAAVARELSRYDLSLIWIDKASDVGTAASSANSAIIHSGHDPEPGTLKARLNREGNRLWEDWCRELNIPFIRKGSLVVALEEQGIPRLQDLLERAAINKIEGVEIISGPQARAMEPLLSDQAVAALWTPTAGLIDPFDAVLALAENAVSNGVELLLDTCFEDFIVKDGLLQGIQTDKGEIQADYAINCAGVHSDELVHKAGDHPDFHITPRRGEYFVFDPQAIQVQTVLFPLPGREGKGTLVTTTLHGNTMIGPSAALISDKEDASTTREGMELILDNARKLVPDLNPRDIIASYSGIRASANLSPADFIIESSVHTPGVVHTAGIESPGLASAPAIALRVAQLLEQQGLVLNDRSDWYPYREHRPVFKHCSPQEQQDLIRQDPLYGRVVCRCELVTEAEIVRAIRSVIPARDYDAVKRRCWLGTGRCQGSFDYPRILDIMARELKQDITSVSKKGRGSEYILRRTKDRDVDHG